MKRVRVGKLERHLLEMNRGGVGGGCCRRGRLVYRVSGVLGKVFSRGLSPVLLWPVPCPSTAVGVCVSMRPNERSSGEIWFWSTFLNRPTSISCCACGDGFYWTCFPVPRKELYSRSANITVWAEKSSVRPCLKRKQQQVFFGDVATVLHA